MDMRTECESRAPTTMGATSDILDYATAAVLLGVPIGTLYSWVHHRRVPHIRLGRRAVRFSRSGLADWLSRHSVPAK